MSADENTAIAPVTSESGAMLKVRGARAIGALPDDLRRLALRSSADRNLALAWGLAGIVLCADLVWFSFSRLRIADPKIFALDLAMILGMVACYVVLRAVRWRLAGDTRGIARWISYVSERISLATHSFIFLFVLFGSVVGFTYLSAAIGWPLRDPQLAQLDQWLGFDWPGFLAQTNSHALWARVLALAYDSSGPQLILLYLCLGLAGRQARLAELSLLLSLTSIVTIAIYLVIPAAGAYTYYTPDAQLFDHLGANAGMWHYDVLSRLRNDAAPSFAFEESQGLVVFPSFHTVLAMLMPYGVRDVRGLVLPVAALNVLVIIATVPVGGHHLVDVIAGIAIAGTTIGFVRRRSHPKS